MSDNRIWGPVVSTQHDEENPDDPISVLIKKVEEIKKNGIPMEENETLDEYSERLASEINRLEHEISDKIYQKKIKNIGKSLR